MLKTTLEDVTLVLASDVKMTESLISFEVCRSHFDFADYKFFTSKDIKYKYQAPCKPLNSREDYSEFIIKELPKHIYTPYALIVQWDGFIVNPDKWTNEFLEYDYLGAPWSMNHTGGNGGFSLRSKRLLDAANETISHVDYNEDWLICAKYGEELKNKGVKYAPYEINFGFSSENISNPDAFGFHDLNLHPEYKKYIYGDDKNK